MAKITKAEIRESMKKVGTTSLGDKWRIVQGSKIFVYHGSENKAVDFFYKKLK